MEPDQFSDMIKAVRRTEIIKGKVTYEIDEQKKGSRKYRRSLFVTQNVKAGDIVSDKNIKSIRPSGGLEPREYYNVIGRSFNRDIMAGTPLTMEILD
jgi:pseudaminic acid synthase